jgi:uncharacterized protein (DUF2147 family)
MRATVVVTVIVAGIVGLAIAADGDAIVGVWATEPDAEDGNAHVEVWKDGDRYFGKIIWLEKPEYAAEDPMAGQPKVDRENPDESLRDRSLIGLPILEGFRYAGDGEWDKGTIYDPDNGKTYKSVARLSDDGSTLKVRGFIGFSLLGRTTEWTRVEP